MFSDRNILANIERSRRADRATYASRARGCAPHDFIAFGMCAANIPRQICGCKPIRRGPARVVLPAS
jgi:hypothetical protein